MCTAVCIVLWCGVFSWAEPELQHWQCVLSTAPPSWPCSYVASHAIQQVDVGWSMFVCVFVFTTSGGHVVCHAYAWTSVALECVCRCELHPNTHTSVFRINMYIMCVGCFFIAAIMFADSHSRSPSDWTPFTPSFPPPLPLVTPHQGVPLVTPTQTHPLNPHCTVPCVDTVAILPLLSAPHDIIIISL